MMHRLQIDLTWNEFINLQRAVQAAARESPRYYGPSLRLQRLLKREYKRNKTGRFSCIS